MPVNLMALSGPLKGKSFELELGKTLLGSKDDCDIVVPGRQVHMQHVVLMASIDGTVNFDNRSPQGILVNKSRAEKGVLLPGDTLQIGDSCLFRLEKSAFQDDGFLSGLSSLHKTLIASVVGVYLVGATVFFTLFGGEANESSAEGMSLDYIERVSDATRNFLIQVSGSLESNAETIPTSEADEAASYFRLIGAQEGAADVLVEQLIVDVEERLTLGWRLEKQGRSREAVDSYLALARLIPNPQAPSTRVASYRLKRLSQEDRNDE